MTPETRACLRAMALVRRWLASELDWQESYKGSNHGCVSTMATLRSCIQALHPARNPRLKAALSPIKRKGVRPSKKTKQLSQM